MMTRESIGASAKVVRTVAILGTIILGAVSAAFTFAQHDARVTAIAREVCYLERAQHLPPGPLCVEHP